MTKKTLATDTVAFRLPTPTLDMLRARAAARQISSAMLVRELVETHVNAPQRMAARKVLPAPDELRRLLMELTRQGHNLNQIAMRANSGETMAMIAADLAAQAASIASARQAIIDALGVPRSV